MRSPACRYAGGISAAGCARSLAPTLAKVVVRGRREALANLRADAIDAFVDLAGLGAGRYSLRVQADPAADFGVITVTPSVVVVTIK